MTPVAVPRQRDRRPHAKARGRMTREEWAEIDEELFALAHQLRGSPARSRAFRDAKERFGILFVRKLGGWLAARYGNSFRAAGLDAEEALHEAYLRIHRRLFVEGELEGLRLESAEKLRNYLFTVAQKAAVTALAERPPRPPVSVPVQAEATPGLHWIWRHVPFLGPQRRGPSRSHGTETDFTDSEEEALFAWYVDKSSHEELAGRLGITRTAAKQLVYRAKLKLVALLPSYAAQEFLLLLSPTTTVWLEERVAEQTGSRATPRQECLQLQTSALDTVFRLADLVRVGLEDTHPQSFRSRCRRTVEKKARSGLARACGASAKAIPELDALSEAAIEMLSYLILTKSAEVPKNWSRRDTEEGGELRQITAEESRLLVFLFFCQCALLPERPEIAEALADPARSLLSDSWPAPDSPSPDWDRRATEVVHGLDAFLSGERDEGGADRRSEGPVSAAPTTQMGGPVSIAPEACLMLACLDVSVSSESESLREDLRKGALARVVRGAFAGQRR